MSSKMGRPKIDNPKNERITVRLDSENVQILKKYCEQKHVEKAEAIRHGIKKLKSEIKE